jgi:hypothetical protein
MLVHLETALLFEVAHENRGLGVVQRKESGKHPWPFAVKPNSQAWPKSFPGRAVKSGPGQTDSPRWPAFRTRRPFPPAAAGRASHRIGPPARRPPRLYSSAHYTSPRDEPRADRRPLPPPPGEIARGGVPFPRDRRGPKRRETRPRSAPTTRARLAAVSANPRPKTQKNRARQKAGTGKESAGRLRDDYLANTTLAV